jgi:hypothetical protein
MPNTVDLLKEARETRDVASRARRLVQSLSDQANKDRVSQYAQELEDLAAMLEGQAETRSPAIF